MYSIEEIKIICEVIKKRKYWLPKYFDNLSDEEIQKYCNGIGAEFFPKFLRKWLNQLFFIFEASACVHDVEYAIGGKVTYSPYTEDELELISPYSYG